ncbi:unnamed protein product, partial [Owenia fusiformis]
ESSGGVATTLHLFSPLTKGLVHGVIPQSGQANSYWGIKRQHETARPYAFELGRLVGCPQQSSKALITCMRGKPYSELVQRGENDVSSPWFTSAWAPVIDGYYILEDPLELIRRGKFWKIPMITGANKEDGSDELNDTGAENGYTRSYLLSQLFEYSRKRENHQGFMYDAFTQEYHPDPYNNVDRHRDIYIEFNTDHSYTAPAIEHSLGHCRQVNNTYFYSFEHRSINCPEPVWKGVIHGAELDYMFGIPFFKNETCPWGCHTTRWAKQNWTNQDRNVSLTMMTLWANFIKMG